jgi:Icc-related predicted phosphoesterase
MARQRLTGRGTSSAATILLATTAVVMGIAHAGRAEAPALVTGPYLQQVADDAMMAVWCTDGPCAAWVKVAGPDGVEHKVKGAEHGLVLRNRRIHKVTMPDLASGQAYTYRVCWGNVAERDSPDANVVELGPFTFDMPAHDAPFSFVAFSDIHNNLDLFQKLAAHTQAANADFVAVVGDMVGHLVTERITVRDVLDPLTRLTASSKPFVWVRGNHETRGPFAYRMPEYVATPEDRFYYTFTRGPVFFIVLDSGEDKPDDHEEYAGLTDFDAYRAEEGKWLRGVLASEECAAAEYRVVLVHDPPTGSGYTSEQIRGWAPMMNEAGVDLLIGGHLHEARLWPAGTSKMACPVVQCGGSDLSDGAAARIDIEDGVMQVRIIDASGNVLYEISTAKGKAPGSIASERPSRAQ